MSGDHLYESLKVVCGRRRSVRSFDDRALDPMQIQRIREIAMTSPYASSRRSWEVLAVTDRKVIADLAELVRECSRSLAGRIREDFRKGFLGYAENFTCFETAPALFIPAFRVQPFLSGMLTSEDDGVARWERDTFVKSISCVAMSILLAAASLGLGACYMTGPLVAEAELRSRLGLRSGREIAAVIPVGYPKES